LFGLDDALSSDVHQVIRINFTRASRTGQISFLEEKLVLARISLIYGVTV
jgi:hypothetical protein